MKIIGATTAFELSDTIRKALKELDVGRESTTAWKLHKDIFYTLNVSNWREAYRGAVLKVNLTENNGLDESPLSNTAIANVIAICNYLVTLDEEPGLAEITIDAIIGKAMTNPSSKKPGQDYTKAGYLETFTGKDEDWPFWKQSVEAHLKIAGLHQILVDPLYAKLYTNANMVVHGMLTKCLLKTGDFAHFPCLIDNEGDGNAAWNKICAYYEHELLVKNNLRDLHGRFEALILTKPSNMHEFISEFIWLMNKLDWFNKKAETLKLKGVTSYKITDWKIQFLQKIELNQLKARIETLTRDDSSDLWYTILSIKGYLLENTNKPAGKARNRRGKKADDAKFDDEDEDPEPEPRGKKSGDGPTIQALASKINAIDDPELKKKFKELIKPPSSDDRNGYRKKRRHGKGGGNNNIKQAKRRSTTSEVGDGNNSDIDEAALQLWHG
jgi:hypothetical protein